MYDIKKITDFLFLSVIAVAVAAACSFFSNWIIGFPLMYAVSMIDLPLTGPEQYWLSWSLTLIAWVGVFYYQARRQKPLS